MHYPTDATVPEPTHVVRTSPNLADKNQGDEEANRMFTDIARAYEVRARARVRWATRREHVPCWKRGRAHLTPCTG